MPTPSALRWISDKVDRLLAGGFKAVWDELKHPRGPDGRFIKKWGMSDEEAKPIAEAIWNSAPRTFPSDAAAGQYAFNQHHRGMEGSGKGGWDDSKFIRNWRRVNQDLQDGSADDIDSKRYVDMMDRNAVETDADLYTSTTLPLEAFGLTADDLVRRPVASDPGEAPHMLSGVDDLTGRLFADRGYLPTAIGSRVPPDNTPDPKRPITLSIFTPRGTKAIFPGRDAQDRRMVLDRDQELRVTHVEARGNGYDVFAVATPRTPGRTPEPLMSSKKDVGSVDPGRALEPRYDPKADILEELQTVRPGSTRTAGPQGQDLRDKAVRLGVDSSGDDAAVRARLLDLKDRETAARAAGKGKNSTRPPKPAGAARQAEQAAVPSQAPAPAAPVQQQAPAPQAPGAPAPRTETLARAAGGAAPSGERVTPPATHEGETGGTQDSADFWDSVWEGGVGLPSGPRRKQVTDIQARMEKGTTRPPQALRELEADIEMNKSDVEDMEPGPAQVRLQREIDAQERIADQMARHFNLGRTSEGEHRQFREPTPGPTAEDIRRGHREGVQRRAEERAAAERAGKAPKEVTPTAAEHRAEVQTRAEGRAAGERAARGPKEELPTPEELRKGVQTRAEARVARPEGGGETSRERALRKAAERRAAAPEGETPEERAQRVAKMQDEDLAKVGLRRLTPEERAAEEPTPEEGGEEGPAKAALKAGRKKTKDLVEGDRILAVKGKDGEWKTTARKTGAGVSPILVSRVETEKVKNEKTGRTLTRLVVHGQDENGNDVTIRGLTGTSSFWNANAPESQVKGKAKPEFSDLDKGTKADLLKIAEDEGVPGIKKTALKADIQRAIRTHRRNKAEGVETPAPEPKPAKKAAKAVKKAAPPKKFTREGEAGKEAVKREKGLHVGPEAEKEAALRAEDAAAARREQKILAGTPPPELTPTERELLKAKIKSRQRLSEEDRAKAEAKIQERIARRREAGRIGETETPSAKGFKEFQEAARARTAAREAAGIEPPSRATLVPEAPKKAAKAAPRPKLTVKEAKQKSAVDAGTRLAGEFRSPGSKEKYDLITDSLARGDLTPDEAAQEARRESDYLRRAAQQARTAPGIKEQARHRAAGILEEDADKFENLFTELRRSQEREHVDVARGVATPAAAKKAAKKVVPKATEMPTAPRATEHMSPERVRGLETAWDEQKFNIPDETSAGSLDEIRADLATGKITPDEAVRRLESDIGFNSDEAAEIDRKMRAEHDTKKQLALLKRAKELDKSVKEQRRASVFLRRHFEDEEPITPSEMPAVQRVVEKQAEALGLPQGWVDKTTPEDQREVARELGLPEPQGETGAEMFQDNLRNTVKKALEERRAAKVAKKAVPKKVVAPEQKPGTAYTSPQVREIASGLDISDRWLDQTQEDLDNPKLTPAAVGRKLDQRLRSAGAPGVAAAFLSGLQGPNSKNDFRDPNSPSYSPDRIAAVDKELADLHHQHEQLQQLADRLKRTRRSRMTAPKPEETKLDAPEKAEAKRIADIADVPVKKVEERLRDDKEMDRLRKLHEDRVSGDWYRGQGDLVGAMETRQLRQQHLTKATKDEVRGIASVLGIKIERGDSKESMRKKILDHFDEKDMAKQLGVVSRGGFREDVAPEAPKTLSTKEWVERSGYDVRTLTPLERQDYEARRAAGLGHDEALFLARGNISPMGRTPAPPAPVTPKKERLTPAQKMMVDRVTELSEQQRREGGGAAGGGAGWISERDVGSRQILTTAAGKGHLEHMTTAGPRGGEQHWFRPVGLPPDVGQLPEPPTPAPAAVAKKAGRAPAIRTTRVNTTKLQPGDVITAELASDNTYHPTERKTGPRITVTGIEHVATEGGFHRSTRRYVIHGTDENGDKVTLGGERGHPPVQRWTKIEEGEAPAAGAPIIHAPAAKAAAPALPTRTPGTPSNPETEAKRMEFRRIRGDVRQHGHTRIASDALSSAENDFANGKDPKAIAGRLRERARLLRGTHRLDNKDMNGDKDFTTNERRTLRGQDADALDRIADALDPDGSKKPTPEAMEAGRAKVAEKEAAKAMKAVKKAAPKAAPETPKPAAKPFKAQDVVDDMKEIGESDLATARQRAKERVSKLTSTQMDEIDKITGSSTRFNRPTVAERRQRISDLLAERRIEARATRGSSEAHPGAAVQPETKATVRQAREAAPEAPKVAPEAPKAKAPEAPKAKAPETPKVAPKADESVALKGDPEGDNMRMHGDSSTMRLAQDYARVGRNGSANRLMDLRRKATAKPGQDRLSPQEVVDELHKIRAEETDPKFQRKIDDAIENIDAPKRKMPDLPDGTPDSARDFVKRLLEIPYARKGKGSHESVGSRDRDSLLDQVLEVIRDAAKGERGENGRQPGTRIHHILRDQVHESNEGSFRLWELSDEAEKIGERTKLSQDLLQWERAARAKAEEVPKPKAPKGGFLSPSDLQGKTIGDLRDLAVSRGVMTRAQADAANKSALQDALLGPE